MVMRAAFSDRGAGLAEYALLMLLIAVACLAAVGGLGQQLATTLGNATNQLFN